MSVSQQYVSPDLTHFIGRRCGDDEERYKLLSVILRTGELKRPPSPQEPSAFSAVGLAKGLTGQFALRDGRISDDALCFVSAVCLCDIPLADLRIHMSKYGHFGIAFAKAFIVAQGARPVLYVPRGTRPAPFMSRPVDETVAARFDELVPRLIQRYRTAIAQQLNRWPELGNVKAGNLTSEQQDFSRFVEELPFLLSEAFAFVKFFDETTSDQDPTNYYMEREWRVLTNVRFAPHDVTRVIVRNREYQRRLQSDVPEYAAKMYVP